MGMTVEQLVKHRKAIETGGVQAVREAYADLKKNGYGYGGWAEGVVKQNTLVGSGALRYLQDSHYSGTCKDLSGEQIRLIMEEMAKETLDKYIDIADKSPDGKLNRDLDFKEAEKIHKDIFEKHELSLENWTPHLPMQLVHKAAGGGEAGDRKVNQLWQAMLKTKGSGWEATVDVTLTLRLYVIDAARNSEDPETRKRASHWLYHVNPFSFHLDHPRGRKPCNTPYKQAKKYAPPRDPIVLDLDGNGLQTVGLSSNVYFDHDGDGVRTKTGWTGEGAALLVLDRNGNGSIDSGIELFSEFTPMPDGSLAPNGFAALAALDSNADGVLDASDPAFAELKLWRDTSQDGETNAGELLSLKEAGIQAIRLDNALKNQTQDNGNTLVRTGSFVRADGTEGEIGEFHFAVDAAASRFEEEIAVPDEIKELPNMLGSGKVRDLWQAATQSPRVAKLLEQFKSALTRKEQEALTEELLTAWAATSGTVAAGTNLLTDAGGEHISESYRNLIADWSRKLHVLEAFNGEYFFNLPDENSQTPTANWGLSVAAGSGTANSGSALAMMVH